MCVSSVMFSVYILYPILETKRERAGWGGFACEHGPLLLFKRWFFFSCSLNFAKLKRLSSSEDLNNSSTVDCSAYTVPPLDASGQQCNPNARLDGERHVADDLKWAFHAVIVDNRALWCRNAEMRASSGGRGEMFEIPAMPTGSECAHIHTTITHTCLLLFLSSHVLFLTFLFYSAFFFLLVCFVKIWCC